MSQVRAGAAAALLLLAACGSSSDGGRKEAGGFSADASVPETQDTRGDAASEPAMNLCDPAKQDCPGDEVCGPRCQSAAERFACATEMRGAGGQGTPCTANSDCKKGTLCFEVKGAPKSCHAYCSKELPCPGGTVCLDFPMYLACGGVQKLDTMMCFPP